MRNIILGAKLILLISLVGKEPPRQNAKLANVIRAHAEIAFLNFDNSQHSKITSHVKDSLISSGYQEINSRFSKKGCAVVLLIKKQPYQFLFDTIYKGSLSMKFDRSIPFLKETHQTLIGTSTDFIYNNKWITVNGIHYNSAITVSPSENTSRVGLGFIKGFNWIIDMDSRKVYLKKNTVALQPQNN